MTDKQLISQALSGDDRAYSALFKKYRPGVARHLDRRYFSREELNDLVQETFIKAFRALGGFDGHHAFSTWLYKIATNVFIDRYRHVRCQPETISISTFHLTGARHDEDSVVEYEIPADRSSRADYRLLRAERHQEVRAAILNLPPKYFVVIALRYDEEREYQEIADILQMPLGTVKAHLFRAKQLLSEQLSQDLKAA